MIGTIRFRPRGCVLGIVRIPASKIPRNAVEQRLYTRPMPGGVNLEATIAFLMVDGTIEVLRIDPVTGKATRTTPWTPSDEWEIKSIIDLSSGDVLDPKTRSVVGRAIGGRCGVKPNVERTRADAKRK